MLCQKLKNLFQVKKRNRGRCVLFYARLPISGIAFCNKGLGLFFCQMPYCLRLRQSVA